MTKYKKITWKEFIEKISTISGVESKQCEYVASAIMEAISAENDFDCQLTGQFTNNEWAKP